MAVAALDECAITVPPPPPPAPPVTEPEELPKALRILGTRQLRYARLTTNCRCCGGTIDPGDAMFPQQQPPPGNDAPKRGALEWLHYACAVVQTSEAPESGEALPAPICKHFARSGKCHYGDNCFFAHPADVGLEAEARARARKEKPNARVANRGLGRRNYVKNDGRASVLRRWLLNAFGVEALRKGSGVLDVAAGKGELAWELLNLNAIPSTAVEPRPLALQHCERKWRFGMYWRNPIFHSYLHCQHDGSQATRAPRQLRLLLKESLPRWACPSDEQAELFSEERDAARRLVWTRKGLEEHETDNSSSALRETEDVEAEHASDDVGDGQDVTCVTEAARLVLDCSVVVALHPDQAAEPAIKLALRIRKSFAVVPCCVYAAEFPKRKVDGRPVRTYEDLLQYLQALHPGIRRKELDFEGKNILLYMTDADFIS